MTVIQFWPDFARLEDWGCVIKIFHFITILNINRSSNKKLNINDVKRFLAKFRFEMLLATAGPNPIHYTEQ